MIYYEKGDILDSKADIICHAVNCKGVMGRGLASQIKNKFPQVFKAYKDYCSNYKDDALGHCFLVDNIANLFTQVSYGTDKRQTNYEAVYTSLKELRELSENKSVAFPKKMCCGLGGGNWDIIKAMISSLFNDVQVIIYEKA